MPRNGSWSCPKRMIYGAPGQYDSRSNSPMVCTLFCRRCEFRCGLCAYRMHKRAPSERRLIRDEPRSEKNGIPSSFFAGLHASPMRTGLRGERRGQFAGERQRTMAGFPARPCAIVLTRTFDGRWTSGTVRAPIPWARAPANCASAQGARREDARNGHPSCLSTNGQLGCPFAAAFMPVPAGNGTPERPKVSFRPCKTWCRVASCTSPLHRSWADGDTGGRTVSYGPAPRFNEGRRRHLYARPPFPNALSVSGDDSRWAHR